MSVVWLNGALVDAAAARIDITDRGFLLADGLFETLLARQGHIKRLDEHLERMHAGAGVLGIPMPFDLETIGRSAEDLLVASGLGSAERASLRITLTRGSGPRGLNPPLDPRPTLLITAQAASAPPESMTAVTSKTIRRDAASPLSSVKSLAYTGNILARLEAQAAGVDEALLLNTDGNLASASAANVFLVENGVLATPPVSDGALPGIERDSVISEAQRLGITVREETVAPVRLRSASEIFLTNSLIGICPLVSLDERRLEIGALTERLIEAIA